MGTVTQACVDVCECILLGGLLWQPALGFQVEILGRGLGLSRVALVVVSLQGLSCVMVAFLGFESAWWARVKTCSS